MLAHKKHLAMLTHKSPEWNPQLPVSEVPGPGRPAKFDSQFAPPHSVANSPLTFQTCPC